MDLPLNALRAFEVSARHLSFTRAADELHLTPTAVGQHVRKLEERLGVRLFRRLPRGLALTDEGQALVPELADAFARVARLVEHVGDARPRAPLAVGVVGTFAVGWLLPRLRAFQQAHPHVDLRLSTHNNRVDLATEGLDLAVRFGDGAWHGLDAQPLLAALLTPLCAPEMAARLPATADLLRAPLLRSFRSDEWPRWFEAAGLRAPVLRGPVFDSSLALAEAAAQGAGVALLPRALFARDLRAGRLVAVSGQEIDAGRYWLTRLKSRRPTAAMRAFAGWITRACEEAAAADVRA